MVSSKLRRNLRAQTLRRILHDYVTRYLSKEQMWAPLVKLFPYVRACRGKYTLLSAAVLCDVLVSLYIARFLQILTNSAMSHDFTTIRWMLPIGVGVIVLSSALAFVQTYLQSAVVNLIERRVQSDLYEHTLRLSTERLDAYHSGDIISRLTFDIRQMGSVVGIYLLNIVRMVFTAAGALIYLLTVNWELTIICLATVPPVVIVSMVIARVSRANTTMISESMGRIQSVLNESMQGLSVIRAFSLERSFSLRFRKDTQQVVALQLKNAKLRGGIRVAASLAHCAAFLLSFSLGAYYVAKGSMSVGALLAFMTLMQRLVGPIMAAPNELGNYQAAMVSAQRIWTILDEAMEPSTARETSVSEADVHEVRFDAVSFHYPGAGQALESVKLSAESGKVVALVGPSGAGKSTLFKLLLGLYTADSGRIYIGEQSIDQLSPQQLRQRIAYVAQDTFLFTGSIEENIRYGLPGASREQVIQAASDANAHDFITALPDGYETDVGERALKLSGGQRQRIAIARALLKDAPILLLDEATAALDAESEQLIQAALQRLAQGRTTFVIAHRLSTVVHADYVYVIEKGRVVEEGTHWSLLDQDGRYAELHNMQLLPNAGRQLV